MLGWGFALFAAGLLALALAAQLRGERVPHH
jgi:hypothetical protein